MQVKHHILDLVRQTLPLLDLELLRGRLWIVSESGVHSAGDIERGTVTVFNAVSASLEKVAAFN